MNTEILDYHLQRYLQKEIDKLPLQQRLQLKNLTMCNKRLVPTVNTEQRAFLMRNSNGEAKFFGQVTCKNTFACPHCAAIQMKKYAKRIAAAIDALKNQGQLAIMVTFTIPHLQFQSCREVTDILYQTWKETFINWHCKRDRATDCTNQFFREFNAKYRIRAAEYTYGVNGWHPHFHVLFFVDADKFSDVLKYEDAFNERWQKIFTKVATQYIKKNNLHVNIGTPENIVERLKMFTTEKKAIRFSRNQNNEPLVTTSSAYLAGWTTDKEMTGNVRKEASHNNHYTPYQILLMADAGNEKMRDLYIEFCLQVTRKPVHHRIDCSTGLNKIITQQLNTEGYKEVLKKKSNRESWVNFCWFTRQEWYILCNNELPALENLLYLASINRKDLATNYLYEVFNFELHDEQEDIVKHIEKIFNAA